MDSYTGCGKLSNVIGITSEKEGVKVESDKISFTGELPMISITISRASSDNFASPVSGKLRGPKSAFWMRMRIVKKVNADCAAVFLVDPQQDMLVQFDSCRFHVGNKGNIQCIAWSRRNLWVSQSYFYPISFWYAVTIKLFNSISPIPLSRNTE